MVISRNGLASFCGRKDNEKYGEYFEWLYYKIKKRLKESAKIESHIDIQKQNAEESIFIQKQN